MFIIAQSGSFSRFLEEISPGNSTGHATGLYMASLRAVLDSHAMKLKLG